ncbi:hypothetical protein P154DRAFT_614613 [Amniculicola lignicola CBS 123094]|uniref:F-box domain-containing protein n=1 Tax=Amniculicola lignicola CBS 123094 TaxID=1392246 RepID=A0A6A5WZC9_9PLEO|nr:hypothetical protein P154DRAFT_614613 [Amniculicola lignicola CBS 123094]
MTRHPAPASRASTQRQEASETPHSLELLPAEILQAVLSHLDTTALKRTALVCKLLHHEATAILWREVRLIDAHSDHVGQEGDRDQHDDTPIIQKLHILATNKDLASKVLVLTHRCRLPTPWIYDVLPWIHFDAPTLSRDARLLNLLRLAIQNLRTVHTLRIIFGHWRLTRGLLEGFLDPDRPRDAPLRKLWLESCSLDGARIDFPPSASRLPSGLESIRFRRLRAERKRAVKHRSSNEFWLARGGNQRQLHNGHGGFYVTDVEVGGDGRVPVPTLTGSPRLSTADITTKANMFDDLVWDKLQHIQQLLGNEEDSLLPRKPARAPNMPMLWLISMSQSTLTRLSLDWILWRGGWEEIDETQEMHTCVQLNHLAQMRFPNLHVFQLRNAVVKPTKLPGRVFLLETNFLEFMEAHPKIRSLAWPLDRFYSHIRPSREVQMRVRKVVSHLGSVLVDLRLDASYDGFAEQLTDRSTQQSEAQERIRRRIFIAEFAPCMTKIEQIKIEGGIPRDEKREIVRALHYCPLKKVVMIGASFPVGNTWGINGIDLHEIDPHEIDPGQMDLEEEDGAATRAAYGPTPQIEDNFEFTPTYGWPSQPPLLHTLAAHHASTITELKICGYVGAPILSYATPITSPLLHPLQHFPHLRHLIISFWLLTRHDGERRDEEIINSWMATRRNGLALPVHPPPRSSTPMYLVAPTIAHPPSPQGPPSSSSTPPPPPIIPRFQAFDRWNVVLKTRFTPSALAYQVAREIGPHLSPVAKSREGGVRVRASFWLGEEMWKDIFDLDVLVGDGAAGDEVGMFLGPREEGERGRWWGKLATRGWF